LRESHRRAAGFIVLPLLLVSGCRFTTRKLPVPKAPSIVQSATAGDLVKQINDRWEGLTSMYATVEIQASTLKSREGVEKDYTTFPGIIMMRKPEMLRVYGRVPVIGTQMFSMASDGRNFTLYIPSRKIAYEGLNALTKKSANTIENMRPGFFFDALVVRGLSSDDFYTQIADTETIEDPSKKHLYIVPEYVLSITRHNPGSRSDTPVRVITFHRDDLLPYQQDLYDESGNLETEVFYSKYAKFGTSQYPATVIIKRPLEEYQIVMTVQKVVENMPLTDDQFQIKLPEDTKIQRLQ
jgi:outer membrane lipoprotein-sorting protein